MHFPSNVCGLPSRPLPALLLLCIAAGSGAAQQNELGSALRVRNNHEFPYAGPVQFRTRLPDGAYGGAGAAGEVRDGVARVVASIPATSEATLSRTGPSQGSSFRRGSFSLAAGASGIDLRWGGRPLGSVEFSLAVLPGTTAGPDDAVRTFSALDFRWTEQPGGVLRGDVVRDGFAVQVALAPYGGGWLDVRARLARAEGANGVPASEPAYLALVRRVTTPGVRDARVRFNGRVLDGADSPSTWDRDFWYTRGVDWISWRAGNLSIAAVNGFTPVPTIKRDSAWVEASHFYVWERTRREGDHLYLFSEVAGPNPEQAKSRYMPVTPYAPLLPGDTVDLKWRLALDPAPTQSWEESQLRVFAGYRASERAGTGAVVQLGVPHVTFGTSYFPYSTLTENFDFYRTAGQDRETFWAFSPKLWEHWRTLVPRMRTDLHIIRAMGFEMVRLHHLELLTQMDRAEALAFLDFFTDAARQLGLAIVVDTEGPPEWVAQIAGRYKDIITRFELENEVLIGGIKPGDPARWTALYQAAKQAAPDADVFLTAAGNNGMFERLRQLGVPFDRVGLHAYKHGPQWKESFSSHMLGTAGYASDLGKPVTLGEFNWKELTRLSPEARRPEFAAIYATVLAPRAIPELIQFQLQESLSFNPAISGTYTRHYEPLSLDRRPKPEAWELMRLIREYGPADAPVRDLPIAVQEIRFAGGRATASFTVTNRTPRAVTLHLQALSFDGVESRLASPATLTLQPAETHRGQIEVRLAGKGETGTYHHFVRADFGGKSAFGWGVAANPGSPVFEKVPVLGDRVRYPQGVSVVERIDWSRPLAVAFGPGASVIEVETAYTITNTLQSATGRPVRLSSTVDLPDSLRRDGTVVLLGTSASNPLVGAGAAKGVAGQGVVVLRPGEGRGQWLILGGADKEGVQAAAIDFVLRYWKNAKDATTRITGLEPGNALGNRVKVTVPDPP
ncbi:MAG: hypothetical protein M3497_00135 [Gemmatimonadota bacterium]|nr:hypothetical protein [Gemmatimonadota bacterium]